MTTPPLTENNSPADDGPWQTKYRAERARARILGATTVGVSLLAVGLGAWGLNAQGAASAGGPGQFGGPNAAAPAAPAGAAGSTQDGMTGPPAGGPMGQDLTATLLNSDGSVNAQAVTQFSAQMPSGALDHVLGLAVANGELTQEQATDIAAAAALHTDEETS